MLLCMLLSGLRSRWSTAAAVTACGLLFWTDTIYGAAGSLVTAVVLVQRCRGGTLGWRNAAVVVGVICVWALPTLPGALTAARSPTLPGHDTSGQVSEGQRPSSGAGRGSGLRLTVAAVTLTTFGAETESRGLGVLAMLVLVLLVAAGVSDPAARPWTVALLACIALCLVAGSIRSIRVRNALFLVPLASVVAAAVLPTIPRRWRDVRGVLHARKLGGD